MLDKTLKVGAIGGLLTLLAVVVSLFTGSTGALLGATWNGGTSHTNSQFDAVGGFSVNGNSVITSSTAFTIGQGTALVKETCGTTTWNPGSLPKGETTSTNITVTGATIAQNQVYFGGINTSTLGMQLDFNASGTGNLIVAQLTNASGTGAVDIATATIAACYQQF